MRRKKISMGFILIIILIGIIFLCFSYCSKPVLTDKYIGVWYDTDGIKDSEIIKDGTKYKWQTYYTLTDKKGEKAKLYKNGYIDDGYLLFEEDSRFYGFEYNNENEIYKIILWKPEPDSLPSECEKEIKDKLVRGKE